MGLELLDGGDWSNGYLIDNPCVKGIFPVSYCWKMDSTRYLEPGKGREGVEKFAQVVHGMTALLDEEIDLAEGQIVKIMEIIDKDWYRGQSLESGKVGTFPSAFVRIVDSFPSPFPPDGADLTFYLKPGNKNNNDYMNTANAFRGLDENLKALTLFSSGPATLPMPKEFSEDYYFRQNLPATYGSVSLPPLQCGGDRFTSTSKGFQELANCFGTTESPLLERPGYGRLDENFRGIFKDANDGTPELQEVDKSLDRFSRLSENLSLLNAQQRLLDSCYQEDNLVGASDDAKEGPLEEGPGNHMSGNENSFRYQNVTQKSSGYSGKSVNVKPYGIAKYNFVAQFNNELSLSQGEMVYIRKYVDQEWMVGEVDDGRKGLVPISYVNIIVDENYDDVRATAVTVHGNLTPDSYHKVLYTFQGQIDGDLTIVEGEVVRVKEQKNQDWVVVENSLGESGLCPGNHLDPEKEFDGGALFDIERLLNYKASKVQKPNVEKQESKNRPPNDLKFFDPLRSPDKDLMAMEIEIKRRAEESLKVEKILRNPSDRVMNSLNKGQASKPAPKDINTAISQNLEKLDLLRPLKPTRQNSLDISKSILYELRGSSKANPPPPRPPQPKQEEQKKKPPKPPPPAPLVSKPAEDLMVLDVSPVYATVDKLAKPTRKPPPRPTQQLKADLTVQVEHKYDDVKETAEPVYVLPKPPSRSVSLKPRLRGEIQYSKPAPEAEEMKGFPPDRMSPMSPPPTLNPPKIQTLPYRRCESVASVKSKLYISA